MKMNKKTVFSIVGAIVLGALGSALWDFSKPLLSSCTALIANLSTLGFETLRDAFYIRAARSLGRPVGIGYSMTFLICIISIVSATVFQVLAKSTEPEVSSTAKNFKLIFYIVFFIFVAQLMRSSYVLQLATYYELLEVRAAPYISDTEMKKTRALFAQVKTKKDYLMVTDALSNKIRAAGEVPPVAP